MCRWRLLPELALITSMYFGLCSGHLNLYISSAEMKRLTGLPSKIFYVQNGVVNTYAFTFEIPVQANISHLEFHWFTENKRPLSYRWSFEYNNRAAMRRPTFNIEKEGTLPNKDSTFQVELNCTGEVTAEVKVLLFLNVSAVSHRHNETFLTFRRNKICLKRTDNHTDSNGLPPIVGSGEGSLEKQQQQLRKQMYNPLMTSSTSVSVIEETNEVMANTDSTSGRVSAGTTVPEKSDNLVFYISLACFCGLLTVVLAVIFYSTFVHSYFGLNKLRVSRSHDSVQTSYTSAAYAPNPSVFVRLASAKNGNYATISSLHKYPTYVSPYATSYITPESICRGRAQKEEHIYSNPETSSQRDEHIYSNSETSSKISYYASSQLINSRIPKKFASEDPRHPRYQRHIIAAECYP